MAKKYRFDTANLRVNKAIGGEAKDCLYKNNRVVMVKYRMQTLLAELEDVGANHMRINEAASESFSGHCLRIDITWPNPFRKKLNTGEDRDKRDDPGVLLMLLPDAMKLFAVLDLQCRCILAPGVQVRVGPDGESQVSAVRRANLPKITVTIGPNQSARLNHSEQTTVINALPHFIGRSLAITDFDLDQQRDAAERQSRLSLVWPLALSWNLYEAALAYKLQADDLVRRGDPKALLCAYSMYSHLICRLECAGKDGIMMPSSDDGQGHVFDADIHGSRLVIAIRIHRFSEAIAELNGLKARRHELPATMMLRVRHFSAALEGFGQYVVSDLQVERSALTDFLARLESFSRLDTRMEHDRTQVLSALARIEQADFVSFDAPSLSIYALPVEPFDYHRELGLSPRPSNLLGCQDVAHLRSLTAQDRERIRELQQKHRLLVTNFE
ncbi:hypothetical protein LTR86_004819 [Recurvomyces mirabilis]|nr:hypothetical protein LTR86_004819 [Recurvomyces mirabilis]